MSTVLNGVIQSLSVSQAEQFDPEQKGGCPRRWWLERVDGHRPEKTKAHADGDWGHELLAGYLSTGVVPTGRVKMGKHVRGAIAAGQLPAPGADLLVERRFDGQPKHDAAGTWLPLKPETTLWLGGVPWDGFVDLRFCRGPSRTVSVWDHKFSSDIEAYALPADQLIRTVQMPVYALDSLRIWPDATAFTLAHHYVSRRGVKSFVRSQTVGLEQIRERTTEIEALVKHMQTVAQAKSQVDVPFNRRACSAWSGCPHQSICTAFKENQLNLTPEDLALFGDIDPSPSKAPAPLSEIPLPTASVPLAQAVPVCAECSTELSAENGSRTATGWKHIGCPAAPPAAAKCTDCPHPAHPGAPCGGKRGRGACRCGASGTESVHSPPAEPLESSAYQRFLDAPETRGESVENAEPPSCEIETRIKQNQPTLGIDGGSIPMLLWCPACHERHVDVAGFAEKSHHTHACQSCGLAWRPALVATVGVQFLPGFKD